MTMKRTLSVTVGLAALGVLFVGCSITTSPAMERGTAFYQNSEYVAAADAFSEAIAASPRSAAAWNNRAAARLRLGDVNAAIADYNKALELAPSDAEIYANRGNALVAAGQYQDAIADYTRALELNPSYARAAFNRGSAYAMLGQRDAAQAEWARAIALERDPWTKAAMQRSAGLGPAPAIVSVVTRDTAQPNVASAPAPGTGPSTVPIARTPSPVKAVPPVPPAGSPQIVVTPSVAPAASPQALDARALASRAITREIDGDHAGALQDLNTALTLEPDAARRASLTNLLRFLETPR
jgi:tetratricopeptide (TPR) repeat protein